ncbi:MAG: PaaI family thioesterase [Actinomycetia bacterium]|nr:PaaI family thioesterase [Actinomycetes bacterium]
MADEPEIIDPIPLHEMLGLEFERPEFGERTADVSMPVRREAFGFTGNLHGGAIATLVDLSCALAAAQFSGFDPMKESLVTADMHVRYLGRPKAEKVVARSEVVKIGSQLIVVECKVIGGTNDDGEDHVIAVADFSMMKVPVRRPLSPDIVVEPGDPEL